MSSRSRGAIFARVLQKPRPSFEKEGAGNAGCTLHPRSRVREWQSKVHTSIQVQRKHSGIPRAMALRLIPRSPRRRIRSCHRRLRIEVLPARLSRQFLRKLGISNGCQDHTASPYASAPSSCTPFIAHEVHLALRPLARLTLSRPPHPGPNVRDDRETPLLWARDGLFLALIWGF
jgi:hypothetical protein